MLAGVSTRALAESALRSGFRPRSVDFFGDLDQKRAVPNVALGRDLKRPYSADAASRAASRLGPGAAAYGADLENAPSAVARLARGRELLGNPAPVVRSVRDPRALFDALERAGVPTPVTLTPAARCRRGPGLTTGAWPRAGAGAAAEGARPGARRWLRKPRKGGGGRGIAAARPEDELSPGEILQELVEGPVLSLAFLAAAGRVRPLALSRELEEREAFGAAAFGYAGSLTALPPELHEPSIREQALRAAEAVARGFGLQGWNGMDFVVRAGEVVPLEVNPRHTGSMELWDGPETQLFGLHAAACRGELEGDWLPPPREARGKAILFARRPVRAGATVRWLDGALLGAPAASASSSTPAPGTACTDGSPAAAWPARPIADVPHPGDRISPRQPVCTLYATGASAGECVAALVRLARAVEADLDDA